MKNKIYIFIEEAPYKRGVERYLELSSGSHRDIRLIDGLGEIRKDERALLLTDSLSPELMNYSKLKTYHLSDHSSEGGNIICKYNSFEEIIGTIEEREEGEEAERREAILICLSSLSSGVGKSLIAREAAKILAERGKSALIELYPSKGDVVYPYQLDSLLLSSMNGTRLDIEEDGSGVYRVAPFKLIEDYVDLDIGSFHKLLSELSETRGIEYYVVEVRHFLDRTSRELIRLANVNLLIVEEDGLYKEEEVDYIRSLSSREAVFKIITNKVRRLRREDELPYVYEREEGLDSMDLRYFSGTLRLIMEEL